MKIIKLLILLFFVYENATSQQRYPGGVLGAEAWYIVNHSDLDNNLHVNHAMRRDIRISPCNEEAVFGKGLINFNPSIADDDMCLKYDAYLENSTTRNIFFVGMPRTLQNNISHVTASWNETLLGAQTNALWNRFHQAFKSSYADKLYFQYTSDNNAQVNFYHWNSYGTDRKYNSFGYKGETTFFIGKEFANDQITPNESVLNFFGDFPEYISYPFELTANERNRVESYLALKYGLTLANPGLSYKNAKNVVFWNSSNNVVFGKRIFGIGRDDISGLNQLQSESTHLQKYLVASVGEMVDDNPEKQLLSEIGNDHFIVFGDNNGADGFGQTNLHNVRPILRKWLSQSTGRHAPVINMFLRFNTYGAVQTFLTQNPDMKLWMLHDRYVTNQQLSDFDSQYVEYYEPADTDTDYAYFEELYYDTDKNKYDQYTFGVGPEVIVQVRFDNDCSAENLAANVVITGGTAPYEVNVENSLGADRDYTINENTMSFVTNSPETYTVHVTDANGNEAETEIEVEHYHIIVDLGPNQVLSASQQQVVLDAGVDVNDPNATYKWFKDGVLMEYYVSTLTVDEPGEYKVEVTSGNHSCVVEDTVIISYNFVGNLIKVNACDGDDGSITLNLSGGMPPFISVASRTGYTVSQVHNTETFTFSNMAYGEYTVTTVDINGQVFEDTVVLESPLGGVNGLTVVAQLMAICEQPFGFDYGGLGFACYNLGFELDASQGVTNPNVGYEWFINGNNMNINSSEVELIQLQNADPESYVGTLPGNASEFTIKATNLNTGCYLTEKFYLLRNGTIIEKEPENELPTTRMAQSHDEAAEDMLTAKIYPNPTPAGHTFYYEVTSDIAFEGTVELYSASGAILQQTKISGKSEYSLPLNLSTAGVYFVRTTTADGKVLTNKVIIR